MSNASNVNSTSSRRRLVVIVIAAVVIVVVMLSAFVWPGWAVKNQKNGGGEATQTQSAPATPTIKASALPKDATDLVKALPDDVTNYARTGVAEAKDWASAKPIEEYTVSYSTGDKSKDVTMLIGQWATADSAKTQYDKLSEALTGDMLAHGSVKVSGANKGSYVVRTDAKDGNKAVALWQNDTVVFRVSGSKAAVMAFYQKFPM